MKHKSLSEYMSCPPAAQEARIMLSTVLLLKLLGEVPSISWGAICFLMVSVFIWNLASAALRQAGDESEESISPNKCA